MVAEELRKVSREEVKCTSGMFNVPTKPHEGNPTNSRRPCTNLKTLLFSWGNVQAKQKSLPLRKLLTVLY